MKSITIGEVVYEIYFQGSKCVTVPTNILLQDSIEEMLEDIGEFSLIYLQEVYSQNQSFYI